MGYSFFRSAVHMWQRAKSNEQDSECLDELINIGHTIFTTNFWHHIAIFQTLLVCRNLFHKQDFAKISTLFCTFLV
jgi:hypothetical protein